MKYLQYIIHVLCHMVLVFKVNMAPLRYLKPTDGLPDPKDSLSSSMQPQANAQVNEEVKEAKYLGLINFCTRLLCLKFFNM